MVSLVGIDRPETHRHISVVYERPDGTDITPDAEQNIYFGITDGTR